VGVKILHKDYLPSRQEVWKVRGRFAIQNYNKLDKRGLRAYKHNREGVFVHVSI
jgi:hypothetical protein